MRDIVKRLRDVGHSFTAASGRLEAADDIEFLVAELKFARDAVNEWSAYATDYFVQKWDLEGDLKRIDAAIARFEIPDTGPAGRVVGGGDAAAHPTNHTDAAGNVS